MPRKLPWLDGDSKAATPRTAKRQRGETPAVEAGDAEESIKSATPRRRGRQTTLARADRTPSSSPPPQPPMQEFMKEGLSGDDIWIMVEDEFLATANLYTQHLHHAEYHRLKRLARERAASINDISRAVDRQTTMSGETRRMLESHQRDSTQSRVLPKVPGWEEAAVRKGDESSDEEAPWMHDSHLSGLMGGYRETSAHLSQLTGARSNTRAAAGYSVARHISPRRGNQEARVSTMAGLAREIEQAADTDNEDDLDSPARPLTKSTKPNEPPSALRSYEKPGPGHDLPREQKPSHTAKTTVTTESQRRELTDPEIVDSATSKKPAQSQHRASTKPARKLLTSQFSWDDDFPNRPVLPESPIGRAMKPRGDDTKKKEEKEKKTSITIDEIPTFLF